MDSILRNVLMLGSVMIFIVVVSQACLPHNCSPPKKLKTTPFPQPSKVNRTLSEPNVRAGRKSLECAVTYLSFFDTPRSKWRPIYGRHDRWLIMNWWQNTTEYKKCTHEEVATTYHNLNEHALDGPKYSPGWHKYQVPPENAQYRCITYFVVSGYDLHDTRPYPHKCYENFKNGTWGWVNHTATWHCCQCSYLIRGCLYDKIMFGTTKKNIYDLKVTACATCATHRCNDFYYTLKPDPTLDKYKNRFEYDLYFPQVSKEHQARVDKYLKRNPIVYTTASYLADAAKRGRRTRALQADNRKWFARPEFVDSDYDREEPEEEDTRVIVDIEKFLFNYFKIKRPDKLVEKRMETVMQCSWETL